MSVKKQHILLLIQDEDYMNVAIHHSFFIAKIFNAEVAITKFTGKNCGKFTTVNKEIVEKLRPFPIPFKIFEVGNEKLEPEYSIQTLDAIFIITQFNSNSLRPFPKRIPIFNWILKAKIPSIIVTEQTNLNCNYNNIIVPVNHKKESKEKMIWASYFGRFNKADIHLLTAKENTEEYMRTIKATIIFTKKMYEQFAFKYKIVPTKTRSSEINLRAIKYSKEFNNDLLVLMSNRDIGWMATYSGPKQLKKILREEKNPVLFINPLKDYYLPCN